MSTPTITPPSSPAAMVAMLGHAVTPAGGSKPARSLSQIEARDMVVYYVLQGKLALEKPVDFGKDGKLIYPKVGEKVRVKLQSVAGVKWVPDSKAAAKWTMTHAADARTVTLMVRISQELNTGTWGVTEIYWGGVGVGRDPTDRHGMGFAIDIHGAATRQGKFDVYRDWGSKPVPVEEKTIKGKKVRHPKAGFRLDPKTPAGGFFEDVYDFLTGEAIDGGGGTPTSIGDRSFILCPDTANPGLRAQHQDHIHCEIDH